VNGSLKLEGLGAINFAENTWHYYPRWEHLLGAKAITHSGHPFIEPGGKKRIVYDPNALPKSAALLERTLVYPVAIRMTEEKLQQLCGALHKAGQV
jgi:8-amino-3,8-dideoxy-alpha-D-manno-octulosonate transaminase